MAEVPIYQPSVQVQAPGVPHVQSEPMTSASSPANVFEAQAGIGKVVEEIGSRLEQHMIMQDKLAAQQQDYATGEEFKTELQNRILDPEKGIAIRNQGINALNGVHEFDAMINGTPAQPGKPGTAPLRDQFLKDKSPYEQARLARMFAATESMFRGKLMNNALSQKEAADQQITEARLDSTKQAAALVTPTMVKDPANGGALVPAITVQEREARDSVMNDVHLQMKGIPPEKLAQIAQDHVDEVAKIAVEANSSKGWEGAQKILDASSASPVAKLGLQNHINGARVDQYTEGLTKAVVSNAALRAPSGEIDEAKANTFIQGQIDHQEKSKNPLPPGHADAIIGKLQSQITIQNKAVSQRQQLIMAKASNDIYSAQQAGMSPADAYNKFIKQGQFDNGIERGKAEDVFTKVYEKDPSALDTIWAHMSEAQKTTVSTITNSKEFLDKFPYPDERKTFEDTFKQKILEGHIQNPDAINKLYQDQFSKVPSGAARFMGFGKQVLPKYNIDQALQKNQPVIKAVGGLASAATLAQTLGGPDKLAPDTNESKAVLLLAQYGKPINADTISTVISKHPDLLK